MAHSVREHLQTLHTEKAEHHITKSKHYAALHKHFAKLAEHFGGIDTHADAGDALQKIAELHKAMSEHHTGRAEAHIAHAKELDAPTTKAAGAGDDGDRIVPDGISSILPSDVPSRKVLRPGQPDFDVDVSGVPEMFHKLVGPLEDEV